MAHFDWTRQEQSDKSSNYIPFFLPSLFDRFVSRLQARLKFTEEISKKKRSVKEASEVRVRKKERHK